MSDACLPAYAPAHLAQSILPWTWAPSFGGVEFGQVTVYVGQSTTPELQTEILDKVGSYGRQIGQIGDALGVLLKRVELKGLTEEEQDAVEAMTDQLRAIGRIKRKAARSR